MDALQFLQTGGWPLKADRLQELQQALSIMQAFGYLAGDFAIISGCEVIGSQTGNGIVFMGGEVFNFVGGTTGTRVKVMEQTITKEFKNGEVKPVLKTRHITFASGTGSFVWSAFARIKSLQALQMEVATKAATATLNTALTRIDKLEKMTKVFVANGCIMPWGKPANTIPQGWSPYEAAKGRTLIGRDQDIVDFNNVGKTGGQKTKTLITANLPTNGLTTDAIKLTQNHTSFGIKTGNDTWVNDATISGGGSSQAFDIMNPYMIVEFIHYTG